MFVYVAYYMCWFVKGMAGVGWQSWNPPFMEGIRFTSPSRLMTPSLVYRILWLMCSCFSLPPSLSLGSGSLCADTLAAHPDDFAAFCEYKDHDDNNENNKNNKKDPYETYVSNVRTSAEWGGHLELRALAWALHRPIRIYQALTPEPLEIPPDGNADADDNEPIRLSYHRHYYALGEHYNQVVAVESEEHEEEEEEAPRS